jgi:hypothetical protein
MNAAPGLFDMSFTATRSRRRRLNLVSPNPDSPIEDRLLNPITRHDHRTPASGQGTRSTAPMFYTPEIPTPGWEIFEDPDAQENVEAIPAQPRNMTPGMRGPAAAPFQRQVFVATPQGEEDASSSSSSDAPSPGHRAGPARDEASRIMMDRMVRTLTTVQADDRRRQRRRRRRLIREGRMEEELAGLQADDDGMVARLQERYAELTFYEEGFDPRYQRRPRRRQAPEQAPQNLGLDQELIESQAGVAEQGVAEHGQDNELTQEVTGSPVDATEPEHDQQNLPSEIQDGTTVEQRIYGPAVSTPSPIQPIPAPTSVTTPPSAPAETLQSTSAIITPPPRAARSMGSGPSFAERARSMRQDLDIAVDGDGDAQAEAGRI